MFTSQGASLDGAPVVMGFQLRRVSDMRNIILGTVVGAVILFVWGMVSWQVLGWHQAVAKQFVDEVAVGRVLKENAREPGIYYLPYSAQDHKPGEPAAFVNVLPNGVDVSVGSLLLTAFVGDIFAALLAILLLQSTGGLTYPARLGFMVAIGFAIGFISHFPYWNFFSFPLSYTLVTIADSTAAWFLAGLAMAKIGVVSRHRHSR